MAFRLHWRILICHGKQQETFVDFIITMPETVNIAGQVKAHTSAQVLSHKIWLSCSDWSCNDCYEIKVTFTEENQAIGCIVDLIHKTGKAATDGGQHVEQKGQKVSIDPQIHNPHEEVDGHLLHIFGGCHDHCQLLLCWTNEQILQFSSKLNSFNVPKNKFCTLILKRQL